MSRDSDPIRTSGRLRHVAWLCVLALAASTFACDGAPESRDDSFLITNVRVYDGSLAEPGIGAVRIEGKRIAAVGELEPRDGERVVDGLGQALAPGFIDNHSHHDWGLLDELDALAATSQGITTIIVGQDGGSQFPLSEFFGALEATPAAINVASFSGHGTLRGQVLGDDTRRPSTQGEIDAMQELLEVDLAAGALGLSTGLEYEPGIDATTDEVVALAKVAAAAGGRYISHVRSEDRNFWSAVDELIEIGRRADIPVQLTHAKLAMSSLHGLATELIGRMERARAEGIDVTADIYPYTYWQSTLRVFFPERDFDSLETATLAVHELSTPSGILIPRFAPEPSYEGRTLLDIAQERGAEPAQALLDLIDLLDAYEAENPDALGHENVIATSMQEADVELLMRWEHMAFCSDGGLRGAHPRGFGAFARIFGHYARERGTMSVARAVQKASTLSAERFGFADRGRIEPGAVADLVLFDPGLIADRATTDEPHLVSTGISRVWVGGELVYADGEVTGARPGRVLRRAGAAAADPASAEASP